MTTRNEIAAWFDEAKAAGATHMIVVCDTYSYDNYPIHVMPGEDPRAKKLACETSMQRVMEVYSMRRSKNDQLHEDRAFHYD